MGNNFSSRPLKIGFIVDDYHVSKYVFQLVKRGKGQKNLDISHLIIQKQNRVEKSFISKIIYLVRRGQFSILLQRAGFFIIRIIESLLLRRGSHLEHFKKYSLKETVPNSINIEPLVSKSGFVYRYSSDDISNIRSLDLDILIMCGSGILKGDILNVAKFGIIAFHHGDNRVNRGGPAGFWEVYYKEPLTGFIIQRLTEELDGGEVFFRGWLSTQYYYYLNQAVLLSKSNYYMLRLLNDIATVRVLPERCEPQIYFNQLFRIPSYYQQVKYIINLIYRVLVRVISRELFDFDNRWGVAFSRSSWKNLVMWRANRIKNPPNHFLADPFVINENNRDYCFVEDYDYIKKKGSISVYELKENTSVRIGEAIDEPFHMSFPYLFRYDDKLYMCPETSENNDIRIYECSDFPLKWELSSVIMSDVAAVDTMLFEKDGIWWMFTNIDPAESEDFCSELFIFYSDNPLSNDWVPHTQNPIFCDASRARNGGLLFDDTFIYRVSQRQGFDSYGAGFSVNKISILNDKEYVEEKVYSVEPNFFSRLGGCHHIDSKAGITVFDFVKFSRTRSGASFFGPRE